MCSPGGAGAWAQEAACAAGAGRSAEAIDAAFLSMERAMASMAKGVQALRLDSPPPQRPASARARARAAAAAARSARTARSARGARGCLGGAAHRSRGCAAPRLLASCDGAGSSQSINPCGSRPSTASGAKRAPRDQPCGPPRPACRDAYAARRAELGNRLMAATQTGRTSEVLRLLRAGADPNYTYAQRWTPLQLAAWMAFPDVVLALLEGGANVRQRQPEGFSALHMASRNDAAGRCVALLADAGADLDARDARGRTPLHYAAAYGNTRAVRALLAAGASRHVRNLDGLTAFHVAATDYIARFVRP